MKTRILSWFLILVLLLALLPGAALAAPAEPTGLVAQEVAEDGQLIGPLLTELQLRDSEFYGASMEVVFFYVDPDTGTQTMLYPDQVRSSHGDLQTGCSHSRLPWLPSVSLYSDDDGSYTVFVSGTENGVPYTYSMACRCRITPPAPPVRAIYNRQDRTADAILAKDDGNYYSCQYLDLPEHALWYLVEGGLTQAQADALVVTLDGEPYPFTQVQNASGAWDIKIDLPYSDFQSYSYPSLIVRDGTAELRLGIGSGGMERLPGVVIRKVEGPGYLGRYEAPRRLYVQQGADDRAYVFYYADAEANLTPLEPTAVQSPLVNAAPLNEDGLSAWTLSYQKAGRGNLQISGTHPNGTSYTYTLPIEAEAAPKNGFYLTRDGSDPLLDELLSYGKLTDGTLWYKVPGGVSQDKLSAVWLYIDEELVSIAADGEDAPSGPAQWVLRDDGCYDLKLTLSRPARNGSVKLHINFFDYSSSLLEIWDRTFQDGTEGLLFRGISPYGAPPTREIVVEGNRGFSDHGCFLYCDGRGNTRELTPTAVTVDDPSICTVSQLDGAQYLFTFQGDGRTTVSVTADGHSYTMPIYAHLPELGFYTEQARRGDTLMRKERSYLEAPCHNHSGADADTLWILKDGGFTLAEAQSWTCLSHAELVTLTPVSREGSDCYDLRVELKAPSEPWISMAFHSGADFHGALRLKLTPPTPVVLINQGANVYAALREPMKGYLLLALYDPHGRLLQLDLQDLAPDMVDKPMRLPWHAVTDYRITATALGTFFQPLGWFSEICEHGVA